MKKIIGVIVFLLILSSLLVCLIDLNLKEEVIDVEEKAIFISYLDYSSVLKGKTEKEQKNNIDNMINNIVESNFNMIILQVRPFCDAIYYSKIFSPSLKVVNSEDDKLNFDILSYFIDKSHKNNIKLHAWINPYRIRSTSISSDISKNNIIYKWIGTNNIEIKNGIYLNPASNEVLDLIIKGVEEIVLNYDIDGIIYDDYFYPSNTIDILNYKNYKGNLTIEEYRINNINNLIKSTYNSIKKINSKVLFGISPAGNISNNLNNEYLDIEFILSNNNYIDYVMPQIYYGFNNSTLPFLNTIKIWNDLIINNDTKLYVALALYKSGLEDKYAHGGNLEWIENSDIIKRQILASRNFSKYVGFSIFRYNYYFNYDINNLNLVSEVKKIDNLLKK